MNERALITLGLLLGVGSGKPPAEWVSTAHEYMRQKQGEDPMKAILATVLVGGAAFYAAEHGKNPDVTSIYDALLYVATNLSVGYSDVLAKTDAGKAIGSALMTYGPALAARAFDAPGEAATRAAESESSQASLRGIAETLEHILHELRGSGRAPGVVSAVAPA